MLPSKERIKTPLFKEVSGSRQVLSVYNDLGTLKFLKSDSKKISIVISSKSQKRAVLRNKLKRRVYSIFSKIDLKINGILYTSKKSTTMEFENIKNLTNDLIEKTKRITK